MLLPQLSEVCTIYTPILGLPWWSSGYEPPLTSAGDAVQSLMWNEVSHATGQLSPCASTRGVLHVAVKTQHSQNKQINEHSMSILQMRKLQLGELQTPNH